MLGSGVLVGLPRARPAQQGTVLPPGISEGSAPAETLLGWGCDSSVKPLTQRLQRGGTTLGASHPRAERSVVPAGDMQAARSSP